MAGKPGIIPDKKFEPLNSLKSVKLPAKKQAEIQVRKTSEAKPKLQDSIIQDNIELGTDVDRTGLALKHSEIKPKFIRRNKVGRLRHSFKYFVYARGAALLEKIITYLANILKYLERKLITGAPDPIVIPPSKYKKKGYEEPDEDDFENLSFYAKKKPKSWFQRLINLKN